MMHTIGGRLKQMRESVELDQEKFGALIGATRNTVYRWERGLAYPPADVLFKIYEKYEINMHWLVTGQGDMRGETKLTIRSQSLDSNVLRQVVSQVEDGIVRHKMSLNPDKKARLISLIYENAIETGKPVEAETVHKYIELMT